MKKEITFTVIVTIYTLQVFSQVFNIVGVNNDTSIMNYGVKGFATNILTLSTTINKTDTIYYVGFNITSLDYQGNVLVDSFVGSLSKTVVPTLCMNYKNNYFGVAGQVRYPSSTQPYKASGLLIHKDLKNSYWLELTPHPEDHTVFSNYVSLENANKVVVITNPQMNGDLSTVKTRLSFIDTLGNVLLEKEYFTTGRWFQGYTIHKYENNYYLFIQNTLSNNLNDPTNLVIYKLDTLGNIVNTYQTTNGKWYGTVSSAVLPNGDFIVGGFYSKGYMTSNVNDGIWQQKYLARFDKDLNLIWRKTFGSISGNDEITKVIIASDSTIVGCGTDGLLSYNLNDSITENDTIGHGTGCLFKFSLNGDSIWMRKYQGTDNQAWGELAWLTNMDELPNNQGYVACGYIDNAWPIQRRGWVFRTDANGCLDASCSDKIREVDEPEEFVNLYPNPANDKLTIQCKVPSLHPSESTCKVFDATGREVLCVSNLQQNQSIDISELGIGLYVLSLHTSNGKLFTNKFLVSR